MPSLAPYYQPNFHEAYDSTETVFTWLRIKEPRYLCIYDTEFGYWVAKCDIELYVMSFDDMPADEKQDFITKLKNIK